MIKVFKYFPIEERKVLIPIKESDTEVLFSTVFLFQEPKAIHKTIFVKEEGCFELEENTFFWIHPNCIVCDYIAYKSLNSYLSSCGFWNELILGEDIIYLFTVTKELFSLNEDKSEFIEFDGLRIDVKKYCFNDFDTFRFPIFLLGNVKGHYPLVSESFVNKVKELEIKGMRFELINSSH